MENDQNSVLKRLSVNGINELGEILRMFNTDRVKLSYSGMESRFTLAKKNYGNMTEHDSVLAISIGGTNTKVLLSHIQESKIVVESFRTYKNPETMIDYQIFFDEILFSCKNVSEYLKGDGICSIGVSFPVEIVSGSPFHITKVPTVSGLISRSLDNLDKYEFSSRFRKYLKSRGMKNDPVVFYQGDGIMAHLGAVVLHSVDVVEKTSMLVCGTGMSTGDEKNFVLIGMCPLLTYDKELFPMDETEGGQIQYAFSGKGLYSLMNRSIRIKSKESSSVLDYTKLKKIFSTSDDSKKVMSLWMSTQVEDYKDTNFEDYNYLSDLELDELRIIAKAIIDRAIISLANCVVATIANMGRGFGGHKIFYEGSIATNRLLLPLIQKQILETVSYKDVFEENGFDRPNIPNIRSTEDMEKDICFEIISDKHEAIDYSLIGAMFSVIGCVQK